MIVKNEEAVLERCIKSALGIFDELIIVDTGSSDNTKKIAKKYTDKVYDFVWVNDFSAARNHSFSKASKQYIMWLDADDIILPKHKDSLIALKSSLDSSYDIVALKYDVAPSLQSTRERIFKRSKNYHWCDPVHEYIPLIGNIFYADIAINHAPYKREAAHSNRNIKIYESELAKKGDLTPRGKYYYARELKDHQKWSKAIKWFNLFLKENKGWREDNIAACYNLAICYNRKKEPQKALDALMRSFNYDAPRAEICCQIGYHYKDKGDYKAAMSWFEVALNLPLPNNSGFILKDYLVFIPAIELAVCFDRLKQYDKANAYNEIAGKANPQSSQYLKNKKYFSAKIVM